MRCWKSIHSVKRQRQTGTDRGRTDEMEKGRQKEREIEREKEGQKEAVHLQQHYRPRENVAERSAGT